MNEEECLAELFKLKGNPLKFLDYVYITDAEKGLVKLIQWPHICETIKMFHEEKFSLIVKSRQIGISWTSAVYALYTALMNEYAKIYLMSRREEDAIELLDKCRKIHSNLPEWLRLPLVGGGSTKMLEFESTGSKIIELPATESAGRSADASLIICDEWDYHPFAEQNFSATKPAIDMGSRKFIAVTTIDAFEPDTFCKRTINRTLEGKGSFKLKFLGWNVRPDRDEAWYAKISTEMSDYMRYKEYPRSLEEAMSPLSSISPFDKEALARLLRNAGEPMETRRGYVHIIHPPRVGVHYVGGGDVAEGVGLDSSAFVILGTDGVSSEVCAVIHSNSIRTDMFAWEINELCKEYRDPVVGIENNSIGVATLNTLQDLGYRNLYFSDKIKAKPGWTNTEFTRGVAINELSVAIKDASVITKFKPQVLEMMQMHYNEKRNNRPEAGPGAHDDLVMSLAIGYQMMRNSPKMIPFKKMTLVRQEIPRTFVRT